MTSAADDAAAWAALTARLRAAGQEHVLTPPPPPERAGAFRRELERIDLASVSDRFERSMAAAAKPHDPADVQPFAGVARLDDMTEAEIGAHRARGLEMIGASPPCPERRVHAQPPEHAHAHIYHPTTSNDASSRAGFAQYACEPGASTAEADRVVLRKSLS